MSKQSTAAELRQNNTLAGETQALVQQLGAPENGDLFSLELGSALVSVRSLPELRSFLENYSARFLIPNEFGAILRAWEHASRGELKELLALDHQLASTPGFAPFARASKAAGKHHLKCLRTLKDQRLVQRYLSALGQKKANGWHTVVYGIVLAVYSLPLRQGLLHYARQTLNGFILAASTKIACSGAQQLELLEHLEQPMPGAVQELLRQGGACSIKLI